MANPAVNDDDLVARLGLGRGLKIFKSLFHARTVMGVSVGDAGCPTANEFDQPTAKVSERFRDAAPVADRFDFVTPIGDF